MAALIVSRWVSRLVLTGRREVVISALFNQPFTPSGELDLQVYGKDELWHSEKGRKGWQVRTGTARPAVSNEIPADWLGSDHLGLIPRYSHKSLWSSSEGSTSGKQGTSRTLPASFQIGWCLGHASYSRFIMPPLELSGVASLCVACWQWVEKDPRRPRDRMKTLLPGRGAVETRETLKATKMSFSRSAWGFRDTWL